jgi:hypothetical protein
MRKFSQYVTETCVTSDVNPGNLYPNTGVTNHLTPVGNIVAQIRNLFSPLNGVVASVGEDGFSVKLNSSKFVSQEEVNKVLYDNEVMRGTNMAAYIISQGLPVIKMINVGQYFIVYFGPNDIKGAKTGEEPQGNPSNIKEMEELNLDEVEIISLVQESDDEDEELQDVQKKKISEIINSKDKVKAAKQLELLLTQQLELPREYYFAGVKSKDGDESIALRWKYTRRRPHGNTAENVRSIMNIYNDSKDGIWVQDFDKDSLVQLPEEVDTLIHTVLDFLGASETDDPCVFSLVEGEKKEKKEEDDKNKESSKVGDKDLKNNQVEDTEDDSSRGDEDDDN